MTAMENQPPRPSKEQIIYANLLLMGMVSGIVIMIITYTIYVTGLLPSYVDMHIISANWGKGVHEYLEITHSPHGWGWIALLGKGDFLNYVGFVLLGIMTILCYLVLVRGYFREKNWIFTAISILEIVVLSLAASGLLGSGGH
jgi:magnesium-transporting ATPase (P-type)